MKYLKQNILIAKDCLLYSAIPLSENFIREHRSIPKALLPYCYVTRYADAILLTFRSVAIPEEALVSEVFADVHRVVDPAADLKDEYKPEPDLLHQLDPNIDRFFSDGTEGQASAK